MTQLLLENNRKIFPSARTDQSVVQLLRTLDVLAAQAEQWPDTLVDLFVARHQISEVAHLGYGCAVGACWDAAPTP